MDHRERIHAQLGESSGVYRQLNPGTPFSPPVYGISGRIHLEWSGAGNWGGFVYDYIDARNYREVRVSRSVPGRLGEIVLAETVNGVKREVFRAPRLLSSTDREVFLTLRRENDLTIVNEPIFRSNIQVRQARADSSSALGPGPVRRLEPGAV